MRGSPVPDRSAAVTVIISIHASTWEAATIQIQILKEHVLFQFTPLHERQPTAQLMSLKSSSNFNSRLYMRGSGNSDWWWICFEISIHASTWEAAKASTYAEAVLTLFQFTPLHERQRNLSGCKYNRRNISIHASTWEAARHAEHDKPDLYFNSRLYMRGSWQP